MIEYDEKDHKYVIRKTLSSDRKHDYDFVESFVKAIEANGFSGIQVKLPFNSSSEDKCVSFEYFLELGKIYESQIIVGENKNNGDSVKVLLVDYESKCSFDDGDFSNGSGYPAALVKSSNPVRAHYIISQLLYFAEKEGRKRFFSRGWLPFLLMAFYFNLLFSAIKKNTLAPIFFVQNTFINSTLNALLWGLSLILLIATLVDSKKRLWIDYNKRSFKRWFVRFCRGDFSNNIFIKIVSSLLLIIIGGFINHYLFD